MMPRHVERRLTAYLHGELPHGESRRVGEHLLSCPRCRACYDDVREVVTLAEQLQLVEAPDSLWDEIEREVSARAARSSEETPAAPRAPRVAWWLAAAAAVVL